MVARYVFTSALCSLDLTSPVVQLLLQTPTYRLVSSKPDRYVISCKEDGSIWRAIAENDVPIYTKELILTGVLKQEIDYDDREFMIPGSY